MIDLFEKKFLLRNEYICHYFNLISLYLVLFGRSPQFFVYHGPV